MNISLSKNHRAGEIRKSWVPIAWAWFLLQRPTLNWDQALLGRSPKTKPNGLPAEQHLCCVAVLDFASVPAPIVVRAELLTLAPVIALAIILALGPVLVSVRVVVLALVLVVVLVLTCALTLALICIRESTLGAALVLVAFR